MPCVIARHFRSTNETLPSLVISVRVGGFLPSVTQTTIAGCQSLIAQKPPICDHTHVGRRVDVHAAREAIRRRRA